MKISAQILLAAVAFFVCGANFTAAAQTNAADTDGAAAKLSAAQIKKLRTLNVAVALPTFVPAGYSLKTLDVPTTDAPAVIDYSLVYANAAGKTFTVQSTNDGIGDMIVKEEITGKNPYFDGEFYAGHDESGNNGSVGAQWIGSLKKYQPKTQKVRQFYSLVSDPKSITPRIAARIMKSLRYLKR